MVRFGELQPFLTDNVTEAAAAAKSTEDAKGEVARKSKARFWAFKGQSQMQYKGRCRINLLAQILASENS